MTNNQLTRERIELIANFHRAMTLPPSHDEIEELARMALAAMDSEPYGFTDGDRRGMIYEPQYADRLNEPLPVYRHAQPAKGLELAGWQFKSVNGDWLGLIDEHGKNQAVREGCEVREVFAMADGVNNRDQVRSEHAEWSQATFGNVGPIGPLKHLSKEALEAAAEPDDLSEWADMQFLLWDAQRRAGITDEQITLAMIEKLAVNKQREWPEPKDGEPRLHIKEQPAPVVQMVPEEPPEHLLPKGSSRDAAYRRGAVIQAWKQCRAAMLQAGNSPVIPDGWIKCSDQPPPDKEYVWCWGTYDDLDEPDGFEGYYDATRGKWWASNNGDYVDGGYGGEYKARVTHWMPLPAAPQEVPDEK